MNSIDFAYMKNLYVNEKLLVVGRISKLALYMKYELQLELFVF